MSWHDWFLTAAVILGIINVKGLFILAQALDRIESKL